MRRKMEYLLCSGVLLSAALISPAPAIAQTAPDDAAITGVITVIATKKAAGESLTDTPTAISAFDKQALDDSAFQDLQSLSYAAPGVSLDQVGTFRGVANFAMRGLGINSSIPSIDPAVGTIVDGVYIAANAGVVLDQFDLKSIEIARGPQGVLYGRNTTGGAVLVETANPTFAWEGHTKFAAEGPLRSGGGSLRMTGQAVVSGPLIADKLAIRLGVYHDSDGGWFTNQVNGSSFGKAETTIVRAGLLAHITGRARLLVKGEYLKTTGDGATTQNHGLFSRKSFDMAVDNPGRLNGKSRFVSARLDWDAGPGTLTNIAGWRHYYHASSNDIDSTPEFLFHSNTGLNQEQWSNELRWSGTFGNVDLVSGFYLFHQDVAYAEDRMLPTFSTRPSYGGGTQDHHVQGLFGEADFHATNALTLSAGLRWSHEKKSAAITYVRDRPACWVVSGTCPVTGMNPNIPGEKNGFADKHSWRSLSPRVAVSWRPDHGIMAYASWTRGARSGGYNLRVTQPDAFEEIAQAQGTGAYGPETVNAYEIGLKIVKLDGRASLNLAAYRNDVRAMQREISVPSPTSGLAQYIYNTANARIHGIEAEASFIPVTGLTLAANAGYIDADYVRIFYDIDGDGTIGPSDFALKLPRVPKWTFGGSATYTLTLGKERTLRAHAAYQFRSRYAYTDNNWGYNDSSDMLNASLALGLGNPAITLTLYGKNLLNTVQFGGDTQIPFGGPLSDGLDRPFDPHPGAGTFSPVSKGRTVGISAGFDF